MFRLLLSSVMLLQVACFAAQPCFDPDSALMGETRILAIRADPPESAADLSGAEPLVQSSVSMLVFTGLETPLPTTISICLPPSISQVDAAPGCPAGSPLIASLPRVPTLNAPFLYTPPLALLQQEVDNDPVHGLAGIQLTLQITVIGESGPIVATKTLYYQLKGSAASINHGLEVTGYEESINGVHTQIPLDETIPLIVTDLTGFRPLIGPGPGGASAVESYLAYDNSGQLVQLQEHVTYTLYARPGVFFGPLVDGEEVFNGDDSNVADEPPPGSPDPPNGLISLVALGMGSYSGTIWIIARDGRGAVAWATAPYTTTDLRSCGGGARCPQLYFGCL